MSLENKLHAVLLAAFVALVSAAFVTTSLDEVPDLAAVAKAKATQVASATSTPSASR